MRSVAQLDHLRAQLLSANDRNEIIVSADATCCILRGAKAVAKAFTEELGKAGVADRVHLRLAGCLGFCEIEPMVILSAQGVLYQRVQPEDVREIVSDTVQNGRIIERLLYTDPATGEKKKSRADVPFYGKQNRLILSANELIEPVSIDDYIATGGYSALAKALAMEPAAIIKEMKDS